MFRLGKFHRQVARQAVAQAIHQALVRQIALAVHRLVLHLVVLQVHQATLLAIRLVPVLQIRQATALVVRHQVVRHLPRVRHRLTHQVLVQAHHRQIAQVLAQVIHLHPAHPVPQVIHRHLLLPTHRAIPRHPLHQIVLPQAHPIPLRIALALPRVTARQLAHPLHLHRLHGFMKQKTQLVGVFLTEMTQHGYMRTKNQYSML